MAVGPHIYFANIRHDYKWGYFSNTVVYAFKRADKVEDCVVFWNTLTGEKHAKTVRNLLAITSCKDFCLLAAKVDEDASQVSKHETEHESMRGSREIISWSCSCCVLLTVHLAAVQCFGDASGFPACGYG